MEQLPYGRRLGDLARTKPDESALVFAPCEGGDRRITFAELDERSNQVARHLEQLGVDERSLVVVSLHNSPEHFYASFGANKLGAAVLPLRWDLPDWERERLLEVAAAQAVISDIGDLADAWSCSSAPVPDRIADPAQAIATGGSTGRPKIIVTPEPGLWPGLTAGSQAMDSLVSRDRQVVLTCAPLYHTNGFSISQAAILSDQLVVLMERFDAAQAVELVERYRVNSLTMAPIMMLRIARVPGVTERDFSSIDSVVQGAASCPPWLTRFWIDLVGPEHYFAAYGSSENVGVTFIRGDEWLAHPGSVGRGSGTEIRILDADGNHLPPGDVGEIYMRTEDDRRFSYLGAQDLATTTDGFTCVGDLGWLDADGYLYIADRRVDMIVSGGANVFPAEVEAALVEHPGVADVAVVGVPDVEWGHRVHAIVQPDPTLSPSVEELERHCRERLASYKVPKSFDFVTQLPRSDAGKINRGALATESATSVSTP